jgi:hypothetical protein
MHLQRRASTTLLRKRHEITTTEQQRGVVDLILRAPTTSTQLVDARDDSIRSCTPFSKSTSDHRRRQGLSLSSFFRPLAEETGGKLRLVRPGEEVRPFV